MAIKSLSGFCAISRLAIVAIPIRGPCKKGTPSFQKVHPPKSTETFTQHNFLTFLDLVDQKCIVKIRLLILGPEKYRGIVFNVEWGLIKA